MKLSSQTLLTGFKIFYRRVRRFLVAALLLLVIIQVWQHATRISQAHLVEHAQQLARLTVEQAAHAAKHWLTHAETDGLQSVLDQLNDTGLISAARIANPFGQQLATVNSVAPQEVLTIVHELRDGDQTLGYLTVEFDYLALVATPRESIARLNQRMYWLIPLAIIVGMWLMSIFNRIRYHKPTVQPLKTLNSGD